MTSPTARTLAALRKAGWLAQVVERYCHFSRRRIDLFSCIDIVAIRPGEIMGVQATSASNAAARRTKAAEEWKLIEWMQSGAAFEVWGWAKKVRGKSRPVWEPNISRAKLTAGEVRFE